MNKKERDRILGIIIRRLKWALRFKSPHEDLINNFKFPSDIDKRYKCEIKIPRSRPEMILNGNIHKPSDWRRSVSNYYNFLSHKSLFKKYKGFSLNEKPLRPGAVTIECCVSGIVFLAIDSDKSISRPIRSGDTFSVTYINDDFLPYFLYISEIMKLYYETKEDYIEAKKILKVDNIKNKLRS